MNADGFCDVAAGGSGQVTVWTGNGAGIWTQATNYVIQNDPDCGFEAFRVGGDADHNGFPDIVHLTDEGSWINSYNHLRFYRETTIATNYSLFPVFPHGGEVFKGGSVRFTDWLSAVPGTTVTSMTIEISTTGPTGPWTVLAQNLPNNGRYQWEVPTGITSSNCYTRYTMVTPTGPVIATTPAPFTILGIAPNVSLTLLPVNPPIQIPATGGSFNYDITIANNEPMTLGFSVWITATLPGGSVVGPLINAPLSLSAGGNINRTKIQTVPASAPAGNYNYNAYMGIYPNTIWDEDHFNFTKLAGDK
jgi:hypothetical protein